MPWMPIDPGYTTLLLAGSVDKSMEPSSSMRGSVRHFLLTVGPMVDLPETPK